MALPFSALSLSEFILKFYNFELVLFNKNFVCKPFLTFFSVSKLSMLLKAKSRLKNPFSRSCRGKKALESTLPSQLTEICNFGKIRKVQNGSNKLFSMRQTEK